MQLANDNEELSIALFGQSGSGKTTLIASMVGNLGSKEQMAARGYRLAVHNVADTNTSLARFMKLEKGIFPSGTDAFHTYRFGFCVEGVEEPAFDINLYDYPGGWWQGDAADVEEQRQREEARVKLASAHVGLLCLDGEQLRDHGDSYIAELLESFARLLTGFSQQESELPRSWILAITKADVLTQDGEMPDVRRLWAQLHDRHAEALALVGARLGYEQLHWRLLLLAAARVEDGLPVDVHAPLGIELIIPLSVRAALDAYRTTLKQSSALNGLGWVLGVVPKFKSWAKKAPGPVGGVIKVMSLFGGLDAAGELLYSGAKELDKRRDNIDKQRHKVEAALHVMRDILFTDIARALYAESGKRDKSEAPDAASISYQVEPRAVLWRTRGLHLDYNFICKPDVSAGFEGWYRVWEQIFGKLEPRAEPIYLMGLINDAPYLASTFVDAVRRDAQGRPIRHSVLWLLTDPLEPNPFGLGQVPANWAAQLVDALSALPEIAALLETNTREHSQTPQLLRVALEDADHCIDASAPINVAGSPAIARYVSHIKVNGLSLPSLGDWISQQKANRFQDDLDKALLEGDMCAMLQHLGLPNSHGSPTLRIKWDQATSWRSKAPLYASLAKQLVLSFRADPTDHFVQHRVTTLHDRLLTWKLITQHPRPGFDALLAALRRHDKDVALAAEPLEADQRAMIAEWLGEALISDAIVTNLRKALLG
jgi:GTPase SAR1 family protein